MFLRLHQSLIAMPLAVVLAVGCLPSTAQELRLAPDRPLTFADADGRAVRSTEFRGQMAARLFRLHALRRSVPDGLERPCQCARSDRTSCRAHPAAVRHRRSRARPGPAAAQLHAVVRQAADRPRRNAREIKAAADALGVSFEKVAQGAATTSSTTARPNAGRSLASSRPSLRIAEPHLIAARLIEALTKAGVPLDNVNNVGAYR